jgi:NAD+ kinase
VLAGGRAIAGGKAALLPINLGGLGFLTVAESREVTTALKHALAGSWPVVERRMLSAIARRRGRTVARGVAMNDAVIKGAGGYAAIHLKIATLGSDLGHLVADGLIAATAAGSTAYSLSAGGPLLAPDVEAMVVTPVCAHSLGSRALVLAPGVELDVKVLGSFDRTVLLFDGQESVDLAPGDDVRVRLDRTSVRMFQNPERPFGSSLQKKLGWQGSKKRSM